MNEMRKLMEAVNGLSDTDFLTEALVTCPDCNGNGVIDGADPTDPMDDEWCNTCNGKGEVYSSKDETHTLREYSEDSEMEEIADELEEMKAHIENLMHEIGNLIDQTDERQAARAYWFGHIMGALDGNSEYMSGSMTTMQDSIDAIRESAVDSDEDGYDEDGYDRDGNPADGVDPTG